MKRLIAWIKALVVLLVLAVLGTGICIYAGVPQVGADVEHKPATYWLLQTIRERSVARQARGVAPGMPAQMDEQMLHAAVIGFEGMCAGCHAPPGRDASALARGLNPPAPDLAIVAGQRSAAELFWVIRHGIRMTGMPAWGKTHADDELWPLVALMLRFPDMDGKEYARMLAAAREAGVTHEHGDDQGEVRDDEHDHPPAEERRQDHHQH